MVKTFNTIEDMENAYYGDVMELWDTFKDAAIETGTTGVRNVLFGAKLWEQINVAATTWGVLPKWPYEKGGMRVVSAASSTSSSGLTESGGIPATLKPTFAEITYGLKELGCSFEMSAKELAVEGKDDTITWAAVVEYMAREFQNRINRGLNTDNDTLAGTNIESIDRIVGSYSEIAGVGQTAGDLDPWTEAVSGIDRDAAATVYDSYVSHASGVDRYLTLPLINTVIANVRKYWNNPASTENKVFITGETTLARWSELMSAQQIYDTKVVKFTVNGMQTPGRQEGGYEVAAYKGIPIITDENIQADTIDRIYLLDLDHIGISVAKPTQYLESEDYQALDKFTREGVFYAIGELVATKFKCHGKIRDLK